MKNEKSKALMFANIILCSTVITFILAILYIWYRSNALQIPLNLKFIVLLSAGLFISTASLYIPDNWKINVAIIVLSAVVAAYGLEIVLFVSDHSQFSSAAIDKRSKLEVIEDLRAEGVDAWPQVLAWLFTESNGLPSGNDRVFPLAGISEKTIVYCNETGEYKIFKSDEHGFNNPHGTYSSGNLNAVLVGDSFTIGSCVREGEDITSQLRNLGINGLNLGNGGNGPLIELALLKEYVEPIGPDIVLWLYYEGNDLLDLGRERKASMLMRYLEDDFSQNLLARQNEIDSAMITYVNSQWTKKQDLHRNMPQQDQEQKMGEKRGLPELIKLWHVRSRLGLMNTAIQSQKRTVNFKEQLSFFSKILSIANKRTSGWGGKLYFVYLPTMERYVNGNNNGSFYDRDDVLTIIRKNEIPVIDFNGALEKHTDPLSLTPYLGAHYNAEGYKLLSKIIISRLKKDGFFIEE